MAFEGVMVDGEARADENGEAVAFDEQDEAECCCGGGGGPGDPKSPCCARCTHLNLCYPAESPATCPPEQNVDAEFTSSSSQSITMETAAYGISGQHTDAHSEWTFGQSSPGCGVCSVSSGAVRNHSEVFASGTNEVRLSGRQSACLAPCQSGLPGSLCEAFLPGTPGHGSIQRPAGWGAARNAYQAVAAGIGFHHNRNHGLVYRSIASLAGPQISAVAAILDADGIVEVASSLDTNLSAPTSGLIYERLEASVNAEPVVSGGCLRGVIVEGSLSVRAVSSTGVLRVDFVWQGSAMAMLSNLGDCVESRNFGLVRPPRRANGLL